MKMSQQPNPQPHTYKQGHSTYTHATQQLRTAEVEAAFLLPYIKPTDHILDVGCGPGTITIGFTKYVPQGRVTGLDIAASVLEKATAAATAAQIPTSGPGSLTFEQGNLLERLPHADESVDVVFASQVFGHIPGTEKPLHALAEIRRVLKPGGILATRDGMDMHFYPAYLDLDRLWHRNSIRAASHGSPDNKQQSTGSRMPLLFRKAGFDTDAGKVCISAGASTFSGAETRKMLAWRAAGQLKEGDAVHKSWIDAGIGQEEIDETIGAVEKWAGTQDAWCASLQCEMLAWK